MSHKIFKITFLAMLITSITKPALAGPDGSPFEGLYVGVTSVVNTFDSTATYREVPNDDFPSNFSSISSSVSSNSYGGGILAGYGLIYGPLYLLFSLSLSDMWNLLLSAINSLNVAVLALGYVVVILGSAVSLSFTSNYIGMYFYNYAQGFNTSQVH